MLRRITISAFVISSLFCTGTAARNRDDSLYVHNREAVIDTAAVVTAGKGSEAVSGIMSGNLRIDASKLTDLPRFMGSTDVLKIFRLMPGVQQTGEMDSGIYIRGGDGSHTSVSLDGARIYAPNHLMGFFSSFNSDHTGSSTMFKGANAGAEFGGSLGGYICISSREDITDSLTGTASAGILSSQGTLAVPLGKKSSVSLSGRGTYFNYMLKGISRLSGWRKWPEYGFSDFNLTWLYRPDNRNRIRASAYFGNDKMFAPVTAYQAQGNLRWKNAAASVRGTSDFSSFRMGHTMHCSYYSNMIDLSMSGSSFMLPSSVADFGYNGDFSFKLPTGSMRAGLFYTLHRMEVQQPVADNLFGISLPDRSEPVVQHDFGAYAAWRASLWGAVNIDAGLRITGAVCEGKVHTGAEPRLSVRYTPLPNLRISASYAHERQYISQVSVSGIGMPVDYWIPCLPENGPQKADCFSAGMAHSFLHGMFGYSAELYYSRMSGLTEADGGMFDMMSGKYDWKEHILYGKGSSYGMELMFRKNSGRLTGWLGYTLGWAMRTFPDIMDGKAFPAKHDRRHSLSAVVSWKPAERVSLSAVFVFATGSAFTMPSSIYIIGENVLHEYGPHNGARMPDYHRLDLSATWDFLRMGKTVHSVNLSVYNAYARRNPLFFDLRAKYDKENGMLNITAEGMVLYTIMPSVSYTFRF